MTNDEIMEKQRDLAFRFVEQNIGIWREKGQPYEPLAHAMLQHSLGILAVIDGSNKWADELEKLIEQVRAFKPDVPLN